MSPDFANPVPEEPLYCESSQSVSPSGLPTDRQTAEPKKATLESPPQSANHHARHSVESLLQTLERFLLVVGGDGTIETLWTSNPSRERKHSILGKKLIDILEPAAFERIAASFQTAIQTGHEEDTEHCVELDDGPHWFALRVLPATSTGASSPALCLSARDVTSHKKMFADLQKNKELLEHAEQLANLGSWECDQDESYFRWSDQYFRMLGLAPMPVPIPFESRMSMIHPEDRELARRHREALLTRGVPLENELRFIRADGAVRWFHSRAVAVRDEIGGALIRGMSQDVTQQREAERKLARHEAMMAQAETLADMAGWEYDPETQCFTWSELLFRLLEMEHEDGLLSIDRLRQVIHPDDLDRADQDWGALTAGGGPLDNELRFLKADGSPRIFHSRAVAVRDASGRIIRISGMSQDVTRQREAEWRLARNEALLAEGEQIANFGTWEYDVKAEKPALLSNQFLKLTGFPRERWTAEAWWERMHPQQSRPIIEQSLIQGKPFECTVRYRMPDGKVRIHLVRALPVFGSDGAPERMIGILQDITEQMRTEEDLHRLTQQLMRTRDQDRREIARELHESVGQTLAGLRMALGKLREALPDDAALASEALQTARDLSETAVREVRTISYLMHPPMLDEAGLGPALRWYVRGFAQRSDIAATIDVPEKLGRLSQEIETTLFRIVQEALTNVHRYSGSRTAAVRVTLDDGYICAEVRDEGCGVSPSPAGPQVQAGVGIASMRERVKLLHGTFEIVTAPGQGTAVRAVLPLEQETPASVIEV